MAANAPQRITTLRWLAARILALALVVAPLTAHAQIGSARYSSIVMDASTGEHLWAERFESRLEDLFDLQDQLTGQIIQALLGHLRTPLPRNRPKSLEAYELCVRARRLMDDSPLAAREAQ
ncbi:MAG: hypothetical protein J0H35_13815, partial [Rhodospirillales bacterium]|nr:hypothetical protein [Rhodospirillales bacterium]